MKNKKWTDNGLTIEDLKFKSSGVEFLQTGTNVETNLVTIKNLSNNKTSEIDYYKLQKILKKCSK